MKFVDEVSITVNSGHGGAGAVSFLRESGAPRGGPDGGDGGRGGHVIFLVTDQKNTLIDFRFRKKFSAEDGHPGRGRNQTGPDGADLILQVPPGTMVKGADGRVLLDLENPGEYLFLKGGRGGKGNAFFKTSINQAPDRSQPGEDGESKDIHLELKLIADVGVIGYPNAGKSTLISRISAARPKIADYPFTTLVPNLGVVQTDDNRSFVVADIPGLVPGAHQGVGLGTQFLRHIERTGLFIHLIDASGLSGREPWQDYLDIQSELKEHDRAKAGQEGYRPLAQRQQLVVLNKLDTLLPEQRDALRSMFAKNGVQARAISAVSGQGMKELMHEVATLVFQQRANDEK